MLSDNKLIKQCLKKNEKAFEKLYNRFAAKMFGVCVRFSKSNHEAEDLLHEGFIRIINKLDQYGGKGSLDGWMRRIMVNTAINYYSRLKYNYYQVEINEEVDAADHYENAYSRLSTQDLLKMIRDLPDGYRMVFNLHVIEGYKHNEIAKMLDISENTSKSQLFKAKRCLKEQIGKEEIEKVI